MINTHNHTSLSFSSDHCDTHSVQDAKTTALYDAVLYHRCFLCSSLGYSFCQRHAVEDSSPCSLWHASTLNFMNYLLCICPLAVGCFKHCSWVQSVDFTTHFKFQVSYFLFSCLCGIHIYDLLLLCMTAVNFLFPLYSQPEIMKAQIWSLSSYIITSTDFLLAWMGDKL